MFGLGTRDGIDFLLMKYKESELSARSRETLLTVVMSYLSKKKKIYNNRSLDCY